MYQQAAERQFQVTLRGTRDGIVFQLPKDGAIEPIIEQLQAIINEGGGQFENTRVIVDFCDRSPDGLEAKQIESFFGSLGIIVRRVTASRPGLRPKPTLGAGAPVRLVHKTGQLPPLSIRAKHDARYIRTTIRAGQAVSSDGNLILIGDVEPGAEVVAGGDVIVWGALRGIVRAGADPAAIDPVICALELQPTQIRIGRLVAIPPNERSFDTTMPQRAYRDGASIVVEPWRGSNG